MRFLCGKKIMATTQSLLLALGLLAVLGRHQSTANSVYDRFQDQMFTPNPVGPSLTNFNQEFKFQCPDQMFVNYVATRHSNLHRDRNFDLDCGRLPFDRFGIQGQLNRPIYFRCFWTAYLNMLQQPVVFQCPENGYVAGIGSFHDNDSQDRRFRLRCCQAQGFRVNNCSFTGWLNSFESSFTFNVPFGKVVTGMASYYENGQEDRRFQLQTCNLEAEQQCVGGNGPETNTPSQGG